MSSVEIAYEEWQVCGLPRLEWVFSVLKKRELCNSRPIKMRVGRALFDCMLREVAARCPSIAFSVDEFSLWAIPCKLDWSLPNESLALEFSEGAQ